MIQSIDNWCIQWISGLHTPVIDSIMVFITSLGNGGFIWIAISFICLFFKRLRIFGILSLVSMLLSNLAGEFLLKNLILRPRPFVSNPDITPLVYASNFSFPSGHSASSFAAAGILMHLGRRAAVCSFSLAGLIAFSRVYVLVHYPTDVIAGGILGLLIAVLVYRFYIKWLVKRFPTLLVD